MLGQRMDDELLTLSHAVERDIDLLIVEELVAGDALLDLVMQRGLGLNLHSLGHRSHRVVHSRRRVHNRREIDICIELDLGAERPAMLLIENKLDAEEQVRQSDSYADEVQHLVQSGRAAEAWSLLICPAEYARAKPGFARGFDGVVSYEEVRDGLAQRARSVTGELARRLQYRAELVGQAIDKSRRGYVAVPLPGISDFNKRYVSLLQSRYPLLRPGPSMLKAGSPGESVTMIFAPETLPRTAGLPQMRIVHQLREANANINFYTWGDRFGDFSAELAPLLRGGAFKLQPTINRRKNGSSGLMVIAMTPKVNNQDPFEDQLDAVLEGMAKTDELRRWFTANQSALVRASQRVLG
jgi:hypothetical protein